MRIGYISVCVLSELKHLAIVAVLTFHCCTLKSFRIDDKDDDKENSHQNPPKKRPSLSLSKRKRFQEVSEEELSACKKKPKSANNERSHQWAFRVYELWVSTEPFSDEGCIYATL